MTDASLISSHQYHMIGGETPTLLRLRDRLVGLLTTLRTLSEELDGVTPRWVAVSESLTVVVSELQSFRPSTSGDRKARSALLALLSDVLDEKDPRVIDLTRVIVAETASSAQPSSSITGSSSNNVLRPSLIPRLFSWSDRSRSSRANGHSHGRL